MSSPSKSAFDWDDDEIMYEDMAARIRKGTHTNDDVRDLPEYMKVTLHDQGYLSKETTTESASTSESNKSSESTSPPESNTPPESTTPPPEPDSALEAMNSFSQSVVPMLMGDDMTDVHDDWAAWVTPEASSAKEAVSVDAASEFNVLETVQETAAAEAHPDPAATDDSSDDGWVSNRPPWHERHYPGRAVEASFDPHVLAPELEFLTPTLPVNRSEVGVFLPDRRVEGVPRMLPVLGEYALCPAWYIAHDQEEMTITVKLDHKPVKCGLSHVHGWKCHAKRACDEASCVLPNFLIRRIFPESLQERDEKTLTRRHRFAFRAKDLYENNDLANGPSKLRNVQNVDGSKDKVLPHGLSKELDARLFRRTISSIPRPNPLIKVSVNLCGDDFIFSPIESFCAYCFSTFEGFEDDGFTNHMRLCWKTAMAVGFESDEEMNRLSVKARLDAAIRELPTYGGQRNPISVSYLQMCEWKAGEAARLRAQEEAEAAEKLKRETARKEAAAREKRIQEFHQRAARAGPVAWSAVAVKSLPVPLPTEVMDSNGRTMGSTVTLSMRFSPQSSSPADKFPVGPAPGKAILSRRSLSQPPPSVSASQKGAASGRAVLCKRSVSAPLTPTPAATRDSAPDVVALPKSPIPKPSTPDDEMDRFLNEIKKVHDENSGNSATVRRLPLDSTTHRMPLITDDDLPPSPTPTHGRRRNVVEARDTAPKDYLQELKVHTEKEVAPSPETTPRPKLKAPKFDIFDLNAKKKPEVSQALNDLVNKTSTRQNGTNYATMTMRKPPSLAAYRMLNILEDEYGPNNDNSRHTESSKAVFDAPAPPLAASEVVTIVEPTVVEDLPVADEPTIIEEPTVDELTVLTGIVSNDQENTTIEAPKNPESASPGASSTEADHPSTTRGSTEPNSNSSGSPVITATDKTDEDAQDTITFDDKEMNSGLTEDNSRALVALVTISDWLSAVPDLDEEEPCPPIEEPMESPIEEEPTPSKGIFQYIPTIRPFQKPAVSILHTGIASAIFQQALSAFPRRDTSDID